MSKRKSFKSPSINKSSKFRVPEIPNYNNMPPIFSLEKIVGDNYCFSKLDDIDKKQFAESIFKRKNIEWKDIYSLDKHGLGMEKIPKSEIKGSIPSFITEDMNDFLVFRFSGKKPMVGYREKNIFYVLWFDKDFTLYKH
jgi:hypothetical protein